MSALFYYTARSRDGQFVRGAIRAVSDQEAITRLKMRALFLTSLSSHASSSIVARCLCLGPPRKDSILEFARSFATLISAGIPMLRALRVVVEQCRDGRLKEALASVSSDVEAGASLSDALARRPKEFPNLVISMVRAGEAAGILDEVLLRLAELLERESRLKKRVLAALSYPTIVAGAACALIAFLLSTVVPMFATIFEQMRVPLPASTRILIGVGGMAHSGGTLFTVVVVGVVTIVASIRRSLPAGLIGFIEMASLRTPVYGFILRKDIVARLSRTLGTLVRAGVGLLQALEVTGQVVNSAPYCKNLRAIRDALDAGEGVAAAMSASALYQPLALHMVRVGEEAGCLDAMLLHIARHYELEVETALQALASIVEPVLIALLGGIVGLIVFSIFIPLYALIGSIK